MARSAETKGWVGPFRGRAGGVQGEEVALEHEPAPHYWPVSQSQALAQQCGNTLRMEDVAQADAKHDAKACPGERPVRGRDEKDLGAGRAASADGGAGAAGDTVHGATALSAAEEAEEEERVYSGAPESRSESAEAVWFRTGLADGCEPVDCNDGAGGDGVRDAYWH